ncbi:MAG: hypothetical protein AB7T07_01275 [Steroidobacteraceae bacterium]
MTTSLEQACTTSADTGSHAQLPGEPVVFTTQTETYEQLLGLTRSAVKQLAIWSTNLDSGLWESPGFLEALKRFVLARRHARVRVLTPQLPDTGERRHALLAMAERLPASFEVRTAAQAGLDAGELLLADDRGVFYRIHVDRWDGMSDLNDPLVARFYLTQFDSAWRAAVPAPVEQSAGF